MTKLLVVGLDGADWRLIRPWVEAGHLPTIARLLAEGCHGPLASTEPPITFPAWSSLMTGVNPGRHGIYDFCERVPGAFRVRFYNAADIRRDPFHRLLSREGKQVAMLGVPLTYPPEAVNGVIIPGFDAPGLGTGKASPDAVHPPGLHAELEKRFGGWWVGPNLVAVSPAQLTEGFRRLQYSLDNKAQVSRWLLESRAWDCFMVVLGETDSVCHYFWQFQDEKSPLFMPGPPELSRAVLEVYRQADATLARLLEALPPDANLVLVSDHGMGGCTDKVAHLNLWLAQEGFLAFTEVRAGRWRRLLQAGWLQKLLNRARDLAVRHVPHRLKKAVFYRTDLIQRLEANIRFGALDWSRTQVYSEEGFQFPSLRLNLQGVEPHGIVPPGPAAEALRAEVTQRLLAWTDPWTGAPVIKRVRPREEVYWGPLADRAPDLLIEWHEDADRLYMCRPSAMARAGRPLEKVDVSRDADRRFIWNRSAKHRPHGIFLGWGPAFAPGREGADLRITDMSPLILYLSGGLIPGDLDGRLPAELLDPAWLAARPPRYGASGADGPGRPQAQYSEAESQELEDRLRALGYLE